jgi:predicted PurR-regulated permease PerM
LNLIKYFANQFILFIVIILTGFYSDSYIRKPFTYTDLIAIIIEVSILIVVLNLHEKIKRRLIPIHLIFRILLSVLAIFIATIIIGILTGEMRF